MENQVLVQVDPRVPMRVKLVKNLIAKANKCYFSVTFVKADGTIRKMVCQNGVKKHLSKNPLKRNVRVNPNVPRFYSPHAKGYRSFNLERVVAFKCGKDVWNINEI